MFAQERHNAIVEEINREGTVLVKELAKKYGVTEDSIRKDLTQLERRGLLKKIYGGAMRIEVASFDHIMAHKDRHIENKQEIARKAAGMIRDGDFVFMDLSTSSVQLAAELVRSRRNVTVVTNMIGVLNTLNVPESAVKFIFLGGKINDEGSGFVGAMTVSQIERFTFNIAFMGVVGVDTEHGRITTHDADDGITKQKVLERSGRKVILLERRKLTQTGLFEYAAVSDFTDAVLDTEPDEELRACFEPYGVHLM